MCIRDSYRTYRQAVKIVVDKDQNAQESRCDGRAAFALQLLYSPFSVCPGASCAVYQRYQDAQQAEEDDHCLLYTLLSETERGSGGFGHTGV